MDDFEFKNKFLVTGLIVVAVVVILINLLICLFS